MLRTFLAFVIGLGTALAAGWAVFPHALYQRQTQPVEFLHKTHGVKSGTAQCTDCHQLREDGAFQGLPSVESCAGCHADAMGTSKAEATLVNGFVKPHKETPWLVYARQPANVRFSHAIHIKLAGMDCKACHSGHGDTDALPVYRQDRVSGYSADLLSMSACEKCHAQKHIEVGCLGCHQ